MNNYLCTKEEQYRSSITTAQHLQPYYKKLVSKEGTSNSELYENCLSPFSLGF